MNNFCNLSDLSHCAPGNCFNKISRNESQDEWNRLGALQSSIPFSVFSSTLGGHVGPQNRLKTNSGWNLPLRNRTTPQHSHTSLLVTDAVNMLSSAVDRAERWTQRTTNVTRASTQPAAVWLTLTRDPTPYPKPRVQPRLHLRQFSCPCQFMHA